MDKISAAGPMAFRLNSHQLRDTLANTSRKRQLRQLHLQQLVLRAD